MELDEIDKAISKSLQKKYTLLMELITPARAAANQMMDAGMKLGAAPLNEILFQIDATDEELKQLVNDNPEEAVRAIIRRMGLHG